MGVAAVVFWPEGQHMVLELLLAPPRPSLQVIVLERVDQDLALVQPRGVGGRIAGPPPAVALGEVPRRIARYRARSPVLDEEDASEFLMVLAKESQCGQVVLGVVLRQEGQLHQPARHHQEYQHVDRPVPGIVEFPLLDRPGDRPPDRVPLQAWKVGISSTHTTQMPWRASRAAFP